MARVHLEIDDPTNSLTLKTILEQEGHDTSGDRPQVVIVDQVQRAVERAAHTPTLLLAAASQIAQAVEAMNQGVFGYIFLPFQPGEADVMVRRAVQAGGAVVEVSQRTVELLPLGEMEARHIEAVLRACNNNQAKAARVLGIGRNTLWRKLKKMKAQP